MLSLRVKGHAGYAEIGSDIVCSAASVLAYTLANSVQNAEDNGWLAMPPVIQMDSGDTVISCESADDIALVVMKSMYTFATMGYALLAQNYPQYVRLIES